MIRASHCPRGETPRRGERWSQAGICAAKRARQLRRSHRPVRLVFLTVHEDADFARAALDAGGLGYVVKARLASDLLPAIRAALADRRFISSTISLEENA